MSLRDDVNSGEAITVVEIAAAPAKKRIAMRSKFASLIFAGTASVIATLGMSTPVRADVEYPWCGYISVVGGSQSCTFATVEQCRAYVAGSGYCAPNPRASALAQMPRRAMRH